MILFSRFMNNSKSWAIFAGFSLIAALEFSRIHVPYCVKNKFKYRCRYLVKHLVAKAARLGSALYLNSEPILYRNLLKCVRLIQRIDDSYFKNINIIDSTAKNCKIRIYSPKNSTDDLQPAMFYYHGGGFCFNSIDDYHHILLPLASELKMILIAVEYPLAPEHTYPLPIEEAFLETNFVLNNLEKYDLNIDLNRIVLAGDSAGANIATVLSILINPPTQYFNMLLPSMIKYANIESFMPRSKMILWHLGIGHVKSSQENFLIKNFHTLLIDEHFREKLKSYMDVNLIPEAYRNGIEYYDNYDKLNDLVYPEKIGKEDKNIDENFEVLLKQLFNIDVSPGLADDELLRKQPKTFMIISEQDTRKDEGLIYAQRLSNNGVQVDIAYYDNVFHTSFFYPEETNHPMRGDIITQIPKNPYFLNLLKYHCQK
ncbi:arylacetamide deacetylase-like 4 [Brachionus plicatilis]|uniref:Arylacetamide deacetylase-like 4 n=1 Tax=Brachionus plicatilis TaxID=10195 RepID=A0A3M7RQ89_BRAPC|nr:arylacetamide deacetylase-like 4 [Brachionus plicatilis]